MDSKKISDFTAHELLRFFEGYCCALRIGIMMSEMDKALLVSGPLAFQAHFVVNVSNQKVPLHGEQYFEVAKFLREEILKLETEGNSKS